MFSGIIKKISRPVSVVRNKNSMQLSFRIPEGWSLQEGESINIDGVCSTVEKMNSKTFSVYYMPETLSKTTFEKVDENHKFNLERCISLNTLISGHLVYGHVDAVARIVATGDDQESTILTLEIADGATRYMVYKGSVAINGVSLTIISVSKNMFSVALIPYTKKHTNLGDLVEGDYVNVEVDMIAKHLEKLLRKS